MPLSPHGEGKKKTKFFKKQNQKQQLLQGACVGAGTPASEIKFLKRKNKNQKILQMILVVLKRL